MLGGEAEEVAGLVEGDGEGLVDDDVLAGADGGCGEGVVAVVGAGDDDEVEVGVGGDLVGGEDGDAGDVGVDGFGAAGADDREVEAGDGADEWGVVDLTDPAVTDETDADVFCALCAGGHRLLVYSSGCGLAICRCDFSNIAATERSSMR